MNSRQDDGRSGNLNNRLLAQFARYAGAGLVGTAVHYAALVLLVEAAGAKPPFAAACGAAVGAAVNYLLNYRLTFRSRMSHVFSAPRFALVAIAGMTLSPTMVSIAVRLGAHYLTGQVASTVLVLVLGYLANRFWTFSEPTSDDPGRG